MALKACPVLGKQKSVDICHAFISGAPKNAEGFVFYGVNESNVGHWEAVRRHGAPWFYIDNSYFDVARGQQYRVTRNRVQVDTRGQTSDGTRFKTLGITLKPWQRNPGGHWIIVEQSPSFMRTVATEPTWFDETLAGISKGQNHKVIVRRWTADKPKAQRSLEQDLQGAWMLITHSSAAAVTSVIEGVPAVVEPLSALAHMQCSLDPAHDERLQTLQVLADNQWSILEIKTGKAWAWLNR